MKRIYPRFPPGAIDPAFLGDEIVLGGGGGRPLEGMDMSSKSKSKSVSNQNKVLVKNREIEVMFDIAREGLIRYLKFRLEHDKGSIVSISIKQVMKFFKIRDRNFAHYWRSILKNICTSGEIECRIVKATRRTGKEEIYIFKRINIPKIIEK